MQHHSARSHHRLTFLPSVVFLSPCSVAFHSRPQNTLFVKLTFLVSLVFLVLGALGDLVVPLTLKYAVDELAGDEPKFPLVPIILYGIASFAATACTQLRDINFAYVSANTERLVALETFEHLQSLSLSFHLTRETGSVLRSVSRGASSFAGLMRVFLFQLTPIFFQVFVVCIFLFVRYKWYFGVVTAAVIILYIAFTFTTTNWRDRFRRIMNQYDNEFNQKATDGQSHNHPIQPSTVCIAAEHCAVAMCAY
jgi:ATP-binding cassette subfamily B protein